MRQAELFAIQDKEVKDIMAKDNGLIVAALVAIVAMGSLIISFEGDSSGAQVVEVYNPVAGGGLPCARVVVDGQICYENCGSPGISCIGQTFGPTTEFTQGTGQSAPYLGVNCWDTPQGRICTGFD